MSVNLQEIGGEVDMSGIAFLNSSTQRANPRTKEADLVRHQTC